jgi:ferredoxin
MTGQALFVAWVDPQRCRDCGFCRSIAYCPSPAVCIGCGACVKACPFQCQNYTTTYDGTGQALTPQRPPCA